MTILDLIIESSIGDQLLKAYNPLNFKDSLQNTRRGLTDALRKELTDAYGGLIVVIVKVPLGFHVHIVVVDAASLSYGV